MVLNKGVVRVDVMKGSYLSKTVFLLGFKWNFCYPHLTFLLIVSRLIHYVVCFSPHIWLFFLSKCPACIRHWGWWMKQTKPCGSSPGSEAGAAVLMWAPSYGLAGSYSQPLFTQGPWQLPAGCDPISNWFSRMNF